jgi:hypothetical protein
MSTSDSIQNRNTLNNLLLLAIMCVMAAGWITFSFLHGADAATTISQERPNFIGTARIKQHRAGANGDLVEGEEHYSRQLLNGMLYRTLNCTKYVIIAMITLMKIRVLPMIL